MKFLTKRRIVALLAAATTCLLLPWGSARAQSTAGSNNPASPSGKNAAGPSKPGYAKYNPPAKKSASATLVAVVVAYIAIWGVLLFYLLLLHKRQRSLQSDLASLKERVSGNEPASPATDR